MTEIKKDIMWRVYLVYFAVFAFAMLIIVKIFLIQFKEGDRLRDIAESQEIVELTITIGYYGMVSRLLEALQVELED